MDALKEVRREFAHANLGHGARTKRLMLMVTRLWENCRGSIAQVFHHAKERQGAYRFVEQEPMVDELERSRNVACAERMAEVGGTCIVAVDQTSVRAHDRRRARGFGSLGNRSNSWQGLQMMTALALKGPWPLGVLAQVRWARSAVRSPIRKPHNPTAPKRDPRPLSERESKYWPQTIKQALQAAQRDAPDVKVWLQCDQAADDWQVYTTAHDGGAFFTVRAYRERRCVSPSGRQTHLSRELKKFSHRYKQDLHLPAREERPARVANVWVEFGELDVELKCPTKVRVMHLWYVQVRERRPPKHVKEPLHWVLATNHPVRNRQDAERVIENYKLRWRVEEFHRALKSGACDIESAQLQSRAALEAWIILVSSNAALLEHFKYILRHKPDAKASSILPRPVLDTLILVRRYGAGPVKPPYQPGDDPPAREVIRWIAQLGGYSHSLHLSPPGSTVLARGLNVLLSHVEARRAGLGPFDTS
jgi:hypothetical protein